jgi:hypothetical protein
MKSSQTALSSTATKIVAAEPLTRQVCVHVLTAVTYYIGGDNTVTTSNGFKLDNAAGPYTLTVPQNEELWAIVASGTPTISVLVQGD